MYYKVSYWYFSYYGLVQSGHFDHNNTIVLRNILIVIIFWQMHFLRMLN